MKVVPIVGNRRTRAGASWLALSLSFVVAAVAVGCGGSATNTTTKAAAQQALWVANGTNVVEFLPAQLSAGSTSMVPHLANNSGVFGAPQGVVFDQAGNLWVIDGGTVAAGGTVKPALYEFTSAQLSALATTNNPVPTITINSLSFTFPQQAVFDQKGNLWVSDNGSNAVFVFTPAQLTATNLTATPNINITSSPVFAGPLGIVFDAAGDLFVANNASTTIYEFKAGHLPTTGSVNLSPDVILSDDGKGSIQAPWALAFDGAGDLWSSNANAPNTVVEFASGTFGVSGSPAPAVTLSPAMVSSNLTLSAPNGIGFDNQGNLAAISSASPFGVPVFGKPQLTAGGALMPSVFLVGNTTTLNAPAGCNFGPAIN